MTIDWLNYIAEKRRANFVRALFELSRLQGKKDLNFTIIGALTLLIQGYLKYTAYYDIDLLFKDINRLRKFIARPKPNNLQIVNYDEELIISEKITSFHTAWSFAKSWFNVDYFIKPGIFKCYVEDSSVLRPYTTLVELKEGKFPIELCIAIAYDILKELTNQDFRYYIGQKIKRIGWEREFKDRLLTILKLASEIGYKDIVVPDFVLEKLQ